MPKRECVDLIAKLGQFKTWVVDYDNTLTTAHDNAAVCAFDVVSNAPQLAVNTFNSEKTHKVCCTDPDLVKMGFCPNGKCRVKPEHWAYRRGNDIVLNGKKMGTWDEHGVKTRALEKMGLPASRTVFLDDLRSNLDPAVEAGFSAVKVDGRSGVNNNAEFIDP